MLTEDEKRRLYDGTVLALDALELALLYIVAKRLFEDGENPDLLQGGVFVSIQAARVVARHRQKVYDAVEGDYRKAFARNAATDIRDSFKARPESKDEKREALAWANTEAGRIAKQAVQESRQGVEKILTGIREGARQGYYATAMEAARMSNVVGYEKALQAAVKGLARNGITAYTYRRKDGTSVRVPADVGIRRALTRAGKDRFDRQQSDIAKRTGARYVDVSYCADARVSHALWEGKRYCLDGSSPYPNFDVACRVGDPVEGYGGYNCHHTRSLVYFEDEPFRFSDPLEGTGYTKEEARALTSQQRALENEVRKAKREKAALQAIGADVKGQSAEIRNRQAQIRRLVSENPGILRREPWREKI